MGKQKESTVLMLSSPRSGSVQPHISLGQYAFLPVSLLRVLGQFLLSDYSTHSYHLLSVVLLFYNFISFPRNDLFPLKTLILRCK